MSIALLVMEHIEGELENALITSLPADDDTRRVVDQGHLQDDPSEFRISVQVFENDPDEFLSGQVTSLKGPWGDEIIEVECGGGVTWNRRFTAKARCLLANTQENIADARRIAKTVQGRIERTLLNMSFAGIADDEEMVVRGVFADSMKSELLQAGGPPDAYDFLIKIRFDLQTEQAVTVSI